MAVIFGFDGGTNVLLNIVLAEDGQGFFTNYKYDDVHGYLIFLFCI